MRATWDPTLLLPLLILACAPDAPPRVAVSADQAPIETVLVSIAEQAGFQVAVSGLRGAELMSVHAASPLRRDQTLAGLRLGLTELGCTAEVEADLLTVTGPCHVYESRHLLLDGAAGATGAVRDVLGDVGLVRTGIDDEAGVIVLVRKPSYPQAVAQDRAGVRVQGDTVTLPRHVIVPLAESRVASGVWIPNRDQSGAIHAYRVAQIHPGATLSLAGLQNGDILRAVDGVPVTQVAALSDIVDALLANDRVVLAITRRSAERELTIVVVDDAAPPLAP